MSHAGRDGLILIVLSGTKLDMIFRIVLFNRSTWRVGLSLSSSKRSIHGNWDIALVMDLLHYITKFYSGISWWGWYRKIGFAESGLMFAHRI